MATMTMSPWTTKNPPPLLPPRLLRLYRSVDQGPSAKKVFSSK